MTKPQNIFIFTLLFSVLLAPNDAFGRKKDRNKHGREDIGAMLEPDAMPIRAIQDRNALAAQSMPFYTHKGNINTKYKEGIDVSHYQGTIDWQRVVRSTNISYVYLKATEGANYVDDTYRRNLTEARRAGLSVGSYHFTAPACRRRSNLTTSSEISSRRSKTLSPSLTLSTVATFLRSSSSET